MMRCQCLYTWHVQKRYVFYLWKVFNLLTKCQGAKYLYMQYWQTRYVLNLIMVFDHLPFDEMIRRQMPFYTVLKSKKHVQFTKGFRSVDFWWNVETPNFITNSLERQDSCLFNLGKVFDQLTFDEMMRCPMSFYTVLSDKKHVQFTKGFRSVDFRWNDKTPNFTTNSLERQDACSIYRRFLIN